MEKLAQNEKMRDVGFWVGFLFMIGVVMYLFVMDSANAQMPDNRDFDKECLALIQAAGKPNNTRCILTDTDDNRLVVELAE